MSSGTAPLNDMAQIVPLTLCFKGSRDYIHGPDFYTEVARLASSQIGPQISRVRITIHRFLRRQADVRWSHLERPPTRPEGGVAEFSALGDGVMSGWFVETDRPVDCRVPYDEDAIAVRCQIHEDRIRIDGAPSCTTIEAAVAMTKLLHQTRIPAVGARWIFTRLDLRRILTPADTARLALRLVDNLHGRLTRTELESGGEVIGSIYFSLLGR